jgi:hypothetical protein
LRTREKNVALKYRPSPVSFTACATTLVLRVGLHELFDAGNDLSERAA